MTTYSIVRDTRRGPAGFEWIVVRTATGEAAFYGTEAECKAWIERNGHDVDA